MPILAASMRYAGLCLALLGWCSNAWSQNPTHPYRTANAIALTGQLKAPFLQRVDKQSVLDAIVLWSAAYRIPIWLDRNVATDRGLTLSLLEGATLHDALRALAEQLDAEIASIDRVVLIVPRGQATAIENAYWAACVAQPKAAWMRPVAVAAEGGDGERASDLWQRLVAQHRLPIEPPAMSWEDVMDDDRWRKFRLENATPLAAACCIVGGFGYGIQVDAAQWRAVPLSQIEAANVEWVYQDEIQKIGKEAWNRWRQQWPDASVKNVGAGGAAKWQISAPVAAHRELVAPLAPVATQPKSTDTNSKRYTGRYRGELMRILQAFAQQTKLQLECPELPRSIATMEIDLDFENLTAAELIDRLAKDCGLKITLQQNVIKVDIE
ncbi:MAG: hypothetical protein ACK5OB_05720 [Pirellula sp.]